jgi:predicted esterase
MEALSFLHSSMEQHEISFQFKARYFKLGEINPDTKQVLFVIHGYGQLAKYFIRKFDSLPGNICVIAPEGLSRFYLESFEPGSGRRNDRVGATWMTKENRLMDIDNYVEYLTSIYDYELKQRDIPVTILGFSQGSATASRWALSNQVRFKRLILWAGLFPPDMDFNNGKEILERKEVLFVYGKKDPFLTDERFKEMSSLSEKISPHAKKIEFAGEHEIDTPTLLRVI